MYNRLLETLKEFWGSAHPLRRISYMVMGFVALLVVVGCVIARVIISGLPPIHQLEEYTPSLTTRVFDSNNQLVAEFSAERRAFLPLSKIPLDMQNAVVAMEDDQFKTHYGVSPKGIARALVNDLIYRRKAQGGSTITQQISKLIFLTPEKTWIRKIREALLSMEIEISFSKQEILQFYLNQIYFGGGYYGVAAASKYYYGKDISELNLSECAMLAGLIPSPGSFSPFASQEKAKWRRSLVLNRMYEEGYISRAEKDAANKEPVPSRKPTAVATQAPYFVEYVRQQLEPKYGDQLWRGGMSIYTTLDLQWQKSAEEYYERRLASIDDEVNKERARRKGDDAKPLRLQGAFIIQDVKTGAIRAMIGGRDFRETQFNRATQAMRQPGSTFKPFVWMAAVQSGMTAATLEDDIPMAFYFDGRDWRLFEGATDQYSIDLATQPFVGNKDFQIWVPNNFDSKFLGKITLRRGLEQSRNLISVRLIDKLGPTTVVEVARKAGVKKPLNPVPSLSLGASAVPLAEMVNAIGTFINGGIQVEQFAVVRVEDQQGRVLEEHIPAEMEAFSPQQSYIMTNMMRGVVDRGTGARAGELKRPIAGKTGTSQDHRDMWFIGATPDVIAGAWMGYDDFATLSSRDWTGGGTVVPWWTAIMAEVLKDQPIREFPIPDNIVFVTIDPESGKIALPSCKKRFREAFIKGTEPKEYCSIEHGAAK